MPQDKSATKEIDGDTYQVTMLDPDTSFDLFTEIVKAAGPAFTEPGATSTSILSAALDRIGLDTTKRIREAMKGVTLVNGQPLKTVYAAHFIGKTKAMVQWLWFALQTQYADFTEGWADILPARDGDRGEGSPSPMTSDG